MEFEKYNPNKHGEPRKQKTSWLTAEMKNAVMKAPIVLTRPAEQKDGSFRQSVYQVFKTAGIRVSAQKLSDTQYKVEALTTAAE